MKVILQGTFIIAGDNIQDQPASFIHLIFQSVQRLLQQITSISTDLVASAAFQYTQHLNLGAIRIKVLPDPAFEFIDQFTGLCLPFFFFMAILQKINKIP